MKVKDLIKKLGKFDPNQKLNFHCSVSGEMGSVSVCMDGDLELEFRDNVDPETGEDIEDGPLQILVLSIDGEETYYN